MDRFIIVLCDALRPDHITTQFMPRLARFRDRQTYFSRHRSVFPSDTRANAASFITGAPVATHGIIGNIFALGSGPYRRLIDTGDHRIVLAEHQAAGQRFITAVTLADCLTHAGRTLALVSSASTGTTTLLGLGRGPTSPFTLSCHDRSLTTVGPLRDAIEADLGLPPPETSPDMAAVEYGIASFLRHIWPTARPDCSVLWFNEPDVSYHDRGPETAGATLQALDTALGNLIDWWDADGVAQNITLVIASDHGQRLVAEPIDVGLGLRQLGLRVGAVNEPDIDYELLSGGFGQIHVREGGKLDEIARAILSFPWVDLLFSPDGNVPPGVLPASAALIDHPRCPDLLFTFGGTAYANGAPNRGMHGGAAAEEMAAFLAVGGQPFPAGETVTAPTCTTDLLPTILSGLGLPLPFTCQGRSLTVAVATKNWEVDWAEQTHEQKRRVLTRFRSSQRIIVDRSVVNERRSAEVPS